MPKKGKKNQSKRGGDLGMSAAGVRRLANKTNSAGVPPLKYATLTYPVAFTSSSITGGAWDWQWRLNSLYDPDFTGGGTQPTTFDQWMTLYDRYRVLSASVDLTVVETAQNPIALAGAPGTDAAPTLTYAGIMGMRGARRAKTVGYFSSLRIKDTILMKDVFGVDEEALMGELNLSGTSSTSAPQVAYYTLALLSAASTGTVLVWGEIKFGVRFEQARSNNVSLTLARPLLGSAVTSAASGQPPSEEEVRTFLRVRAAIAQAAASTSAKAPL